MQIPVAIDLPAVGQNLIDHPILDLYFETDFPLSLQTEEIFLPITIAKSFYQFLVERDGPLVYPPFEVTGFLRTGVLENHLPDIQAILFSTLPPNFALKIFKFLREDVRKKLFIFFLSNDQNRVGVNLSRRRGCIFGGIGVHLGRGRGIPLKVYSFHLAISAGGPPSPTLPCAHVCPLPSLLVPIPNFLSPGAQFFSAHSADLLATFRRSAIVPTVLVCHIRIYDDAGRSWAAW